MHNMEGYKPIHLVENDHDDEYQIGEGADIAARRRESGQQTARIGNVSEAAIRSKGTCTSRRSARTSSTTCSRNGNEDVDRPSNEYVLNVAFFSFLGFLMVQVVFALIAHSQAMLADSAAMAVDAFTYLFNLAAERIKKRPMPEDDSVPDIVLKRRKKRQVLYLEIVPPLVSVATLIAVSVAVLADAVETILKRIASAEEDADADDMPNAWIMFIFSSTNLALDVLNVTCFAKVKDFGFFMLHHLFGGAASDSEEGPKRVTTSLGIEMEPPCESTRLVPEAEQFDVEVLDEEKKDDTVITEQRVDPYYEEVQRTANLNMCSAYTHVVADTLRSVAVVIAASLATIFDFIPPDVADATGAIVVSFIIAISLGPLLAGLFEAWSELAKLGEEERKEKQLLDTLMRDSVVDLSGIDL
mmetsp:Transcript_34551/g.75635  ORF Transcript_34551/g.75635 Transcript_34551/m.75635 type:complete len:414 (+) Transcript_34551:124-1365(+)